MSETTEKPVRKPPEIGPYVVTWLLAGFGIWCLYDGFITTNPDMQEHVWFNRIMGLLLSGAAVVDYYRTRKKLAAKKALVASDAESA
jgi:hypothetical protein